MRVAHRGAIALMMLAVLLTTACTASPEPVNGPVPAAYRYTCCQASDIEKPWHPGDLFVLHWISEALPMTEVRPPTPVMLTAELAGPFTTVDRLKTATTAAPFAQATSIRTTTHDGKAPTSTILIPADAAPGLYRLNFAIDSAGAVLSGSSIIEIVAE